MKNSSVGPATLAQLSALDITPDQVQLFHQHGYLIVDNLLTPEQIDLISDRFDPLFNTQFETGIYPDEWYGRPGLSQPNATQQMTGLWRCDRTLASFTLSAKIAQINATLMGWTSARYGLDTCWIKPPDAPPVYFHRNNTYTSSLAPPAIVTCWIALSDVALKTGSLEIVPGSHFWDSTDQMRFLHAPPEDYRAPLWQAASEAGVESPQIVPIVLPPGSAVFLHGNLWRGSGHNPSQTKTRRSLAISSLAGHTKFQLPGVGQGYIFERYRRQDSLDLDESYYPILWSQNGYRTPFLADYCSDALA
ncbi:phytanoyl-CoA dioxygenase family protein [Leptothoe sp. PORK10 BA2]|uniref:phytanoyl-CoA dioxygenase family protein n=1 Tax=Leptothoe sp. PORK10 BA2 TaxID=3110254 RepID=UPI002B1F7DE3|nr:phytanoyl-CoA dioxygenase family protein [Leptothoe sp. PORK10 BA2]MEA5465838.1 phytanoyl-CoA dioxygenase family protein [Leptothoe sp. PORK10 BA2]